MKRPKLAGSVVVSGSPLVGLDRDGKWIALRPDAESLAYTLNLTDDPNDPMNRGTGEHHYPFGASMLLRVAERLGGTVEGIRPLPPLPPGAVS